MILSSDCTSVSVSAEVGSSMMMRRPSIESARAISTSCCSATESAETGVMGSMVSPTRAMIFRDSSRIRRQSMRPKAPVGARPMKMFSATDRVGIRLSSW